MTPCFSLLSCDKNSQARCGILELPHGKVRTPVFMPVGTNATVKALNRDSLNEMGFNIILANTYHLYLRPGYELIKKAGGLHGFMNWEHNILTDSGGFQVFSLSRLRKISDDGVKFQSHIDGSRHLFTPELVVEIQLALNSDIFMQLDVCTPYGASFREAQRAVHLTDQWAGRTMQHWLEKRNEQLCRPFGIIQGNFYRELREESLERTLEHDFPGLAIGGLSVGEPPEVFEEFLAHTAELLPEKKPRYVMGIGTPEYIFSAVENGIDMFDCVFPTRTARNGLLFTHDGPISIKKAEFYEDFAGIDSECKCHVCQNYSRAYLRHLFRTGEILYSMLASYHNLFFLENMMKTIRKKITEGSFSEYKSQFLKRYQSGKGL